MAKQRVKFTFPQELITLPIIYELGKQFNIVTNIRRADVTEDRGWGVLELAGEREESERGKGGGGGGGGGGRGPAGGEPGGGEGWGGWGGGGGDGGLAGEGRPTAPRR